MSHGGKSRLREKAIEALLSTSTIEAAAEQAGISKRTLLRWLKVPEFRAAYSQAKADMLRSATAILMRKAARSAEVLAEIVDGEPKENQGPRVTAALGLFRLALESNYLENIEERIRRIEEQGREI